MKNLRIGVRLPYQLLIKDDEARREADSKGMNLVVTLVLIALVVIGLILEGIWPDRTIVLIINMSVLTLAAVWTLTRRKRMGRK